MVKAKFGKAWCSYMRKEEFYFDSNCKQNKIHAVKWVPEGTPLCIVQVVHGMCEYIERYEEFAAFLTERNILMVGEDHLGHGKSMGNNPPGYFCEKKPDKVLVENVRTLKDIMRKEYPNIPYVVFGHSMGSFITRNFVHSYGNEIDGAVICATGMPPKAVAMALKATANILQVFKGSRHVSHFINNIAFGSYLKRIPNPKTSSDWLSVNEENVQKYIADPLCGFIFTLNGFRGLAGLLLGLHEKEKIAAIPQNLPLHFLYGNEDPVGDYGIGVEKAIQSYVNAGVKKVSKNMYAGKRHELLNEDNKMEVMNDLFTWLKKEIL